jgi:predicted short-subunit dehydrogenase-like oxidoreductase (DUF2520 family)
VNTFSVVGAGRVGTALAFALTRKGWKLEVVADRDAAAARESRAIIGQGVASADIRRAARGTHLLIISVPDDSVERAARMLARARHDWTGCLVFHTSGLLPAAALDPLRKRGARAASLHPVQSFPEKKGTARFFRGIYWGIEGDREAVVTGRALVKRLGGKAIRLREKDKPLYHAACSLAANAFMALEETAAGLLEETGVDPTTAWSVLLPLVQGTLQSVKKIGPAKALTGPVSRGDIRTVREHLRVLEARPGIREIYVALAGQQLALAAKKGVPAARLRALRRLLEGKRPPLPVGRRTSRRRVP